MAAGGRTLAKFDHDDSGGLTAVRGPDADVAFTTDGDLLTQERWSGAFTGSVTRTFDAAMRTASVSYGSTPIVDYQYDADGSVRRAGALTITREAGTGDPIGTAAGSVQTALDRSSIGEIARLKTTFGSTSVFDEEIQRDALGRVTHAIEHDGATATDWAYAYADDGALSEVRRDGTVVGSYTYDAHGNRVASSEDGTTTTADANRQDAITRQGTEQLTYRKSGELVRREGAQGTTSYDYDERGALRSASLADGTQVSYQLDGAGRRIGRRTGSGPWTHWVYTSEGRGPSVQLADDGSVEARFVYGSRNEVPDLMLRDGKTYALVTDHRGSIRRVVDTATGTVAQRLDYTPWGRVTTDTRPGFQPFGFAGGMYDSATGLVRFGARDYDARLGRWTAPDPAFAGGGDTNLYAYIGNDPVNLRDPSGRFIPILAAAGVGAAVGCASGAIEAWVCGENALGSCLKGAVVGAVGAVVGVVAAAYLPAGIVGVSLASAASSTASTSVKYMMSPEDFTLRNFAQEVVVGTLVGVVLHGATKPTQHPGHPITNVMYSDHPTRNKIYDYYIDRLFESGGSAIVEKETNTDVNLVVQEVDPVATGNGGAGW